MGEVRQIRSAVVPRPPGPLRSTAEGPPPGALGRGTLVGQRFRVVAHLGSGSTGQVHAVDDVLLGQRVALKIFPAEIARDPEALCRLYGEVALARAITDPNVCRVYDVGSHVDATTGEQRPFLTMELVDGQSLEHWLAHGPLSMRRALHIAGQVCVGLRAAHDRGVLHRDLKPANVLVDADGNVRLTDFGLARSRFAREESNAGTPATMAPEQLVGRGASVQSDLFSLGLLLYELFTGEPPHRARTIEELVETHETFSPRSPRDLRPELDRRLARVVLACLAVEPSERPASAAIVERSVRRAQMAEVRSVRETMRRSLTTTLPMLALALFGIDRWVEPAAEATPPLVSAPLELACTTPEADEVQAPTVLRVHAPVRPSHPNVRRYTARIPWQQNVERVMSWSVRSS